jgi:glycine oxidase
MPPRSSASRAPGSHDCNIEFVKQSFEDTRTQAELGHEMNSMADIVIIGGGVIGLSIAYELAGQGARVRVLEQGQFGQESSWAGAGILPPGNPAKARTLEARLRSESFLLWPDWSRKLLDETGIDNSFMNCGGIELSPDQSPRELADLAKVWRDEGIVVEERSARELRDAEPGLSAEIEHALFLPELCQVRNPRHLKALIAACTIRGVELSPGTPVSGFVRSGSRIHSVQTIEGQIPASHFVVCSGAWSQAVLAQAGCCVDVNPVRGQMVLLNALPSPVQRVIEVGPRYVVPRADGRVLVGSTEEHAGFDKRNTAEVIAELLRFGGHLVPALRTACFERCWSGLRPQSRSGLPYIGQVPDNDNLFVAAGHFRTGILLSPITAVLMRQLLLGQQLAFPIDVLIGTEYRVPSTE